MLTEVMRHYGLARPPVDAGFFETEHHAQVSHDRIGPHSAPTRRYFGQPFPSIFTVLRATAGCG